MTETEFEKLYTDTLMRIEDAIEEADADLDYETVNDVLTLTCPDGSAIIITRQGAVQQLWLATRSGGFHFDRNEEQGSWVCTTNGRTLEDMLAEAVREQGGGEITF